MVKHGNDFWGSMRIHILPEYFLPNIKVCNCYVPQVAGFLFFKLFIRLIRYLTEISAISINLSILVCNTCTVPLFSSFSSCMGENYISLFSSEKRTFFHYISSSNLPCIQYNVNTRMLLFPVTCFLITAAVLSAPLPDVCVLLGASVLVHGSEGTDSTLLVTSLAQLILDPDCRTVRGYV